MNLTNQLKRTLFMIFMSIFLVTPTLICHANSAQAPSIIFVVNNPPKGLSLELDGISADIRNTFGESYCAFYNWEYKENEKHFLKVTWGGKKITVEVPPLTGYQRIYTLDFEKGTITDGKIPLYIFFRGVIRLLITLAIEGIIFWSWKFHEKSSWLCFFVINIITQVFLCYYLDGTTPFDSYMGIFALGFLEIVIFAIEMFSFGVFVKEHKTGTRIGYAFVANSVSLLVGSFILSLFIV